MTNNSSRHLWFDICVLSILTLLLGSIYLKTVPRFYGDESWEASIGYNIAREGSMRHGVIEGWGGMHIHFLQNQIIQPLLCSVSFLIFGYGVVPARLPSLLMAAVAVCACYAIMRELFSRRAALLSALILMINPWFFVIARRVRPEIFVLAFASLCLLALLKSRRNNLVWPLLAGMFGGIASLSHPNGFILSGCAFISVMIWRRPEKPFRTIAIAAAGFALTILPYAIYVIAADRNPEVSFAKQMTGGKLNFKWTLHYLVTSEVGRWLRYFQWPKGLPLALLFTGSLVAAFIKSKPADKLIATIVIIFALAMPVTTVNTAAVYLSLLSLFFAMLLVSAVQRIWQRIDAERMRQVMKNWRAWLAGGMVGIYLVFCCGGLFMLLRFNKSDVDVLTNRIAAVTGPNAKIYGNILLQIGADKFNYGYFPQDDIWKASLEDIRSRKYEYIVRLCNSFQASHGVSSMPKKMPPFQDDLLICLLCKNFGIMVSEFYVTGYGPVEIYRIDWNKPLAEDRNFMTKKYKP